MAELTEITLDSHRDLKVDPRCAINVAAKQHIITIRINEIGYAANQFPLFFSRTSEEVDYVVSAVNSFEVDSNLFVKDENWTASYAPIGMQTYPFFIMRKEGKENEFCIGIDEENPAFSTTDGEAIFDEEGKATAMLSRATQLLEHEINNEIQSVQFTRFLNENKLIKTVDVVVQYQSGRVNTLKGLNTVDEKAVNDLSDEVFLDMRKRGYMLPVYSMLTSVFHLNTLLTRHNEVKSDDKVVQVKLDDPSAKAEAAEDTSSEAS